MQSMKLPGLDTNTTRATPLSAQVCARGATVVARYGFDTKESKWQPNTQGEVGSMRARHSRRQKGGRASALARASNTLTKLSLYCIMKSAPSITRVGGRPNVRL